MAIIHIDTSDPRDVRALQLCATSARWVEKETALSKPLFLIPSQTRSSHRYSVTEHACSCEDFTRRQEACKHVKAVRLFLAFREISHVQL